jgi:hypothetical protein
MDVFGDVPQVQIYAELLVGCDELDRQDVQRIKIFVA